MSESIAKVLLRTRMRRNRHAMLYKVTPMMTPPEAGPSPRAPGPRATHDGTHATEPESGEKAAPGRRKRRKSAIFDSDGNEVLITLMCLKCRNIRPLAKFGLRKMADGAIRNQPWCQSCRSKPKAAAVPAAFEVTSPSAPVSAPQARTNEA
jgi:hypothetical protein